MICTGETTHLGSKSHKSTKLISNPCLERLVGSNFSSITLGSAFFLHNDKISEVVHHLRKIAIFSYFAVV